MKLLELFDKTFLDVEEDPYYGDEGAFLYECGIQYSFEADSIDIEDHGFTCRPINTWMCSP
jgi:hypothetical protein